eukprot:TRINITY_DN7539_c0_g1_i2.p1 TRINITY_DN7539_c0_g1~~TRINITY_DN7539_c0_g1_i2.p1  ORF type:complete len:500 (+),score=164.54 TRINITY_DN7539_c0_g1_i2:92-1591(+)
MISGSIAAGTDSRPRRVPRERGEDVGLKTLNAGAFSLQPPPQDSPLTDKPDPDQEPVLSPKEDVVQTPESEAGAEPEQQPPDECPKSFMYLEGPESSREWLFNTFDDPGFSRLAYALSIGVLVCIAVSIIAIVVETLPSLRDDPDAGKLFIAIEYVSSIVFTIEYLCKFYAVDEKCAFVRQPINIIDLVAILPFYVELICRSVGVSVDISILRLLRVVRIFRVFKLSKYSTNIQLCATVMLESRDSLGLMVFMLSIVAVVFSSFEFFCEKGEWDNTLGYYIDDNGNRSKFDSIPATMWWCVVTVMTVGYGDLFPITVPGKLVAAGAMVCAIVIMALPISVVGSNFSRAWSEAKANEDKRTESQQLTACFQALGDSLADHSNILEDILSDVSELCESLSTHLVEAHKEYMIQLRWASGDATALQDPEGKLKAIVSVIVEEQRQLEEAIQQVAVAQDATFELEVKRSLEQCTEMFHLMLQHQELSANVVGMEAVIFGRRLS